MTLSNLGPTVRGLLVFESGKQFEVSATIRKDGIHSDQTMIVFGRPGKTTGDHGIQFALLIKWTKLAKEDGWKTLPLDELRMTPSDADAVVAWLTEREEEAFNASITPGSA